jgi:rare lipoprotein A (peptidoglycan hydrolase)
MLFKKHLLSLAGAALLTNPAIAASSNPYIPSVEFGSSAPGSAWVVPGSDRIQSVRTEVASTASWYGPGFHGRRTASGEVFDSSALTAAHRSLPFGSRVHVTNLRNGRSVVVKITDRGPFVSGRLIDLSQGAASVLGMISSGTAPVSIKVIR